MGVASLVLGIVALCLGVVPFVGVVMFVPALLGLIFGIIEVRNKSNAGQPKGTGIAGIVLSGLAMLAVLFWGGIFAVGLHNSWVWRHNSGFRIHAMPGIFDNGRWCDHPDGRFAREKCFASELGCFPEDAYRPEVPFHRPGVRYSTDDFTRPEVPQYLRHGRDCGRGEFCRPEVPFQSRHQLREKHRLPAHRPEAGRPAAEPPRQELNRPQPEPPRPDNAEPVPPATLKRPGAERP